MTNKLKNSRIEIVSDQEIIDLNHEKSIRVYSYEEALEACLIYFNGDELASSVWINKYALKDTAGNIYECSPDQMHHRMASEIARVEKNHPNPLEEETIYRLFRNFKYLVPQGGSMAGIGNNFQLSSLSNCFVIGNGADSYGGIIRLDEEQAQLMKRRGGVGHDLSHIRPKGAPVKNSALSSTGIVPYMERYSNCTREVAQGGRRGALMLSIGVEHPDVGDFVDAKMQKDKITGANVSVRISDEFMRAVESNEKFAYQYPLKSANPIITKKEDAQNLWSKLVHNSWKSAEPGILFWDTITRESIPDCYGDLGFATTSTNPCGEIPLCPYDSCRLMAINLYNYVNKPFTPDAKFDFKLFKKHCILAQRLMDDIIDLELEKIAAILNKLEKDPEPFEIKSTEINLWQKIEKKCLEGRRTGIGITGEGDMLAALGMTYGSDEAITFCTEVHKLLAIGVYTGSVSLAKERGAFPLYDADREKDNPFIKRLQKADSNLHEELVKYGRRNIALLTIAPTGTTSLMTQTSSGIEPAFMVSYKRRKKINPSDTRSVTSFVDDNGDHWEEYNVFHHHFATWLKLQGINIEEAQKMDKDELGEWIKKSPYHQSTANDIDWVQKVKMQGSIQKWVDHSISVTVNLPNEVKEELVDDLFMTAWKSGCKGITIYRDGSRDGVLVTKGSTKSKSMFTENHSPKRPETLEAEIIRFRNQKDQWIAVVGLLEGKPYEIFTGEAEDTFLVPGYITKGEVIKAKGENGTSRYDFRYMDKHGYKVTFEGLSRSFNQEYWNYAKMISGVLRHGMPLSYVVDLVSRLETDNKQIHSWSNGVTRSLKKFIPDGTPAVKEKCEGCGEHGGLSYREGCLICNNCGFSRCS
jgi:ribonucleoside-diphosphate reductase alpha chain